MDYKLNIRDCLEHVYKSFNTAYKDVLLLITCVEVDAKYFQQRFYNVKRIEKDDFYGLLYVKRVNFTHNYNKNHIFYG